MSEVLPAEGSPVDQGRAQGRALREPIARVLREQRSHHGLISRSMSVGFARSNAERAATMESGSGLKRR